MTEKQAEMLNFLRVWFQNNDHSPSYTDIMQGLELTSKSRIRFLLNGLVERGLIRYETDDPHKKRNIVLTERYWQTLGEAVGRVLERIRKEHEDKDGNPTTVEVDASAFGDLDVAFSTLKDNGVIRHVR